MNYSHFFDLIHEELETVDREIGRLGLDAPEELLEVGEALSVLDGYVCRRMDPAELAIKMVAFMYDKTVDEINRAMVEAITRARADANREDAAMWNAIFPNGNPEPIDYIRTLAEISRQVEDLQREGKE